LVSQDVGHVPIKVLSFGNRYHFAFMCVGAESETTVKCIKFKGEGSGCSWGVFSMGFPLRDVDIV
jgi:hypothetical protein